MKLAARRLLWLRPTATNSNSNSNIKREMGLSLLVATAQQLVCSRSLGRKQTIFKASFSGALNKFRLALASHLNTASEPLRRMCPKDQSDAHEADIMCLEIGQLRWLARVCC